MGESVEEGGAEGAAEPEVMVGRGAVDEAELSCLIARSLCRSATDA